MMIRPRDLLRWALLVAGLLVVLAPAPALAHNLVCEKNVNGSRYIEVDRYPAVITYELRVLNSDLTQPSDVLAISDPLLNNEGFRFTCGPFTLPLNGAATRYHPVKLWSEQDCLTLAAADGTADSYIDNTLQADWDLGTARCSARVVCKPQCAQPPCQSTQSPTRTEGFYKLHEVPLTACLASPVELGFVVVKTLAEALGVLWSNPSTFVTGTSRTELDQARLLLGRQLLVATCNRRLLAAPIAPAVLDEAKSLLSGTSCADMRVMEASLTAMNELGASRPSPASFTPGNPTPTHAVQIARDPTTASYLQCTYGGTP